MLERASPVEIRKALKMAHEMARAGFRFVPMPAADDAEYIGLMLKCIAKLNELEAAAEAPAPQPHTCDSNTNNNED